MFPPINPPLTAASTNYLPGDSSRRVGPCSRSGKTLQNTQTYRTACR